MHCHSRRTMAYPSSARRARQTWECLCGNQISGNSRHRRDVNVTRWLISTQALAELRHIHLRSGGRVGHLKIHLRSLSANQPVSPLRPIGDDNVFYALVTRGERWHIHLRSVWQLRCVRHLKGWRLRGLRAHRSVSETRRDNLIHAQGLASNFGIENDGMEGASSLGACAQSNK